MCLLYNTIEEKQMITKLTQEQVYAYNMSKQNMKVISVPEMKCVVHGKDGNYYLVEGREDNFKFIKTIGLYVN